MADSNPIATGMKPVDQIIEMASGLWLSRSIWAACRLHVADAIGEETRSATSIAASVGADPAMMQRLLNCLAAYGVFERTADGDFRHSPLSRVLRRDDPQSQGDFIEMVFGAEHYDAWGMLDHSVRTGEIAFDARYNMPIFDYFGRHEERAAAFSEAMTSSTRRMEKAIVAAHDFVPFKLAVDVGGSQGTLLETILSGQEDGRGIIFDLPEIVTSLKLDGSGRIDAEAGNFFDSVTAGGDLYLLKFILHDWTDAQCATILANIRAAIADGGRIAIFEMVLPDDSVPHPGWFMDLNMMAMTGGRERTLGEYQAMLADAGFRFVRATPTASPMTVVEAVAD